MRKVRDPFLKVEMLLLCRGDECAQKTVNSA